MSRRRSSIACFASVLIVCLAVAASGRADPYPAAVLRALDKVTARTSTLQVTVGDVVHFGRIAIVVRTCDKRPPEEPPESAAFLEISELGADGRDERLFTGWMFASSPGLSAMEHPIYDVWVLDCVSTADSAASSASGGRSP